MPIVNHVGELVKKRKFPRRKRINVRKVERETGLEYSTCSRWLNNRVTKVDWATLEKWCKYLECGVGDLLEYQEESR
jgi:putative transcriptional regulator